MVMWCGSVVWCCVGGSSIVVLSAVCLCSPLDAEHLLLFVGNLLFVSDLGFQLLLLFVGRL